MVWAGLYTQSDIQDGLLTTYLFRLLSSRSRPPSWPRARPRDSCVLLDNSPSGSTHCAARRLSSRNRQILISRTHPIMIFYENPRLSYVAHRPGYENHCLHLICASEMVVINNTCYLRNSKMFGSGRHIRVSFRWTVALQLYELACLI